MCDPMVDYPRLFTVVYVESDEQIRSPVADLLRFFYPLTHVLELENGDDVKPLALAHHPDLIMSDIAHLGIWGHLVFEQIRQDPQTAAIPFVFLSAADPQHFANVLYEGGLRPPEGFISKPFYPDSIRKVLCTVFPFFETYPDFSAERFNEWSATE